MWLRLLLVAAFSTWTANGVKVYDLASRRDVSGKVNIHRARAGSRLAQLRASRRPIQMPELAESGKQLSAMVVEQRCSPSLVLTVANIRAELPGVPIQVFYGEQNAEFLRETLQDAMKIPHLTLTPLPGQFYTKLNRDVYQILFEEPGFWDMVQGDKVLAFQGDTWLCQNAAAKLQQFLQYDYVGAPWGHDVPGCSRVGNGGLSIRDRRVMIKSAEESKELTWPPEPEDVFFCREVEKIDPKGKPSNDTAALFSVEEYVGSVDPVGTHTPWTHHDLKPEDYQKMMLNCPGLEVVQEAQLQPDTCLEAKEAAADYLQRYSSELQAHSDAAGSLANWYRQEKGVGDYGGTCTCPNGQQYEVGDNNDFCKSLACEGGTPGTCTQKHNRNREGWKVTCGKTP